MSSSAAPADVGILVEENSISIDAKAKAANRFDVYSTISDNANGDYLFHDIQNSTESASSY